MNANAAERMNAISEQGLCIGCGLCQAVAGRDKIRIMKTASGDERPVVVDAEALDDATVDKIYAVCPGLHVEGLPQRQLTRATAVDKIWGPHLRIARAWAGDARTRFEGSTAGVLTALAQFILDDNRADFILHVKASTAEPTFGERHLSFTVADVLEGAGSRYGPAAPLADVDAVLARGQRFAFIGKPCDIAALRNLARFDARVDKLVKYFLTPVCGGYMPPAALDKFLARKNIARADITAMRYRGRGCPGPTRVETMDAAGGAAHEFDYLDVWGDDASGWQLPFRCKICPDGIGEAADIAAADTWHGGSPTPEEVKTDPGVNAVIARTAAGAELLNAAAAAGAVVIERESATHELCAYQPHQVRKKYTAYDRHRGIEDAGRLTLQTKRLRIEELAAERPADERAQQRQGARARAVKANEATPVALAC
ncbi:MAG: Coenzyme F420 hydrogenase/dehydrogenase, beta subunit C-terminal domain [Gammaproteobacteria bacterium]|nr:Coenzyme F420 hydrogenase/dehydrogenase, beta subunit C-terminal domain [Gammaproteobacteria bacterium]